MRGVFRVCPHRFDPHASDPLAGRAQDGPLKLIEPHRRDATIDDGIVKSRHRFVYMRRRPMHPGRFIAFTRKRFGPLGVLKVETAAASPEQQGIGRSSDDAEMTCLPCEAAHEASLHKYAFKNMHAEADDRPMDTTPRPSLVTEARGCLWFVFSDDVQALWRFNSPTIGGPGVGKADGSQLLRVGLPWDAIEDAEKDRQAGVRRVELTFLSGAADQGIQTDGVANVEAGERADEDEAWRLEEVAIRAELDACLVTRDEAATLESGEPLEGMEEWETLRLGHEHMAPWVQEWMPVLTPLYRTMELLSRLPGVGVAGAFGRAINARACNLVPRGHD